MVDEAGESWMSRLPWILLGQRTAFQQDLNSTPAELVFGTNPIVPGDIVGEPGPPISSPQLRSLLESLRAMAAQPAIPTSSHCDPPVHVPSNLDDVTHVRIRRHKQGPLAHTYEGPFEIVERVGKSCIRIRVGSYADGSPRYELQHWENAKPAVLSPDMEPAERKKLGRKPNPANEKVLSDTPNHTTEFTIETDINNNDQNIRPKRQIRPPMRYVP